MIKLTQTTLDRLEELFTLAGFTVRHEKGNFKSGYCILEDKKVVVVNKYFDTESRINSLLDILSQIQMDESKLSQKSVQFLDQIKEARIKN